MHLLVSVSNRTEAAAALAGGTDIIDAKDPHRGALGQVAHEALEQIRDVCAGRVPLTAALGDTETASDIEQTSAIFSRMGAALVKVGFAGTRGPGDVEAVLRAAIRGAAAAGPAACGVVAVAYADAHRVPSAAPEDVLAAAARAGAAGVLLDTADKDGPGLRALMSRDALNGWIAAARSAGLMVAVAGRLSAEDLDWLRPMDIDVVGVRGAACEAGRTGTISTPRVSVLRGRCAARSTRPQPWMSPPRAALG